MQLTGAEIIVECLKEQGVDTVFGYPGGAVLNIYDALYQHQDEIHHILTAHEQGASHAADGYARATGKVGVCIATSGPGATNLVTGIATAYMDSVPMVAITGNVALPLLGKDSFQEVDIAGITMPITKHNYIVKDIKDLADIIRKAFYIAKEGRPGPVLIDVPKDITAQKTDYTRQIPKNIPSCTEYITERGLQKAKELIEQSKKPFIYVGGGVIKSDACEELLAFVEKVDAPIACSLMGQGGFPATHSHYTGMIGMHGSVTSNKGIMDCDLLIAIGARFSDRVVSKADEFAPKANILHIDIDPAEVNKNVKTYHHIIGDVKEVLLLLKQTIQSQKHVEWMEQIQDWKEKHPLLYSKEILSAPYVINKLYELTGGQAVITTDVGQHQMWASQCYKFTSPRTFISSGGLGTMGYGLGACIGAQLGVPEKQVINISGDGSFHMNCNELATAVEYNLPIIVLIMNNHVLGMVRQWQTMFYGERYSHTKLDRGTDFVKLAEAFGAVGLRIQKIEEVEAVLQQALAEKRPVVIDCQIEKDDKVFPMVAPGASLAHTIVG